MTTDEGAPATLAKQTRWLGAGHFMTHLSMLVFSTAALEMSTAFGATYGERLALSTGGFVAFGVLALPWGWVGDRKGAPYVLRIFAWGVALCLIVAALAPASSIGRVWLAVALTGVGAVASLYHPVFNTVIAGWGERAGRAFAVTGVWGNVGIAMTPLVTALVVGTIGWRAAFLVPAAAGIVLALRQPRSFYSEGTSVDAPTADEIAAPKPVSTLIRGSLLVLAVLAAADGMVFNLATIALPKLLAERTVWLSSATAEGSADTLGKVGMLGSIITLFGAGAQMGVGRLLARKSVFAWIAPAAAMQAIGGYLVGSRALAGFAIGILLLFIAIFALATLGDVVAAILLPPLWRGRGYAALYLLSFGSGSMAAPLAAHLADHGGMTGASSFLFGFGAVSFAGTCVLTLLHRQKLR